MKEPLSYKDAGVDIETADRAVGGLKDLIRSTFGSNVVTDVGAFAGMMTIPGGDPDQILVSSMDGVGTKLKVAAKVGRYDTVGRDLVQHCINDIGVHGAEPLFFLDYVGTGKLEPRVLTEVVRGLAQACRENGCALIGGETAEMPGTYAPDDLDLVGCIVGTVRREAVVDGSAIRSGDTLLALPSTGLHTNGYSLARKALFERGGFDVDDPVPGAGSTVGEALLAVHRSYLPEFRAWRGLINGAAHITGGGIPGNVARVLPEGLAARVRTDAWTPPPIFKLIADSGSVPMDDLYRTFNMGVGLIVAVPAARTAEAVAAVGGEAFVVGEIESGTGVRIDGEPPW